MEISKKITGVLFLDRNNFVFFDTAIGASIVYTYPVDIISDLEILHEDAVMDQIGQLIQTNKIPPTELIILLSSAILFEKKMPLPTTLGEEDPTEKFIETVPFEAVSFTKYTLPDGIQVVAANENFYSVIKQAFEKQGFQVMSVFPVNVFQEDISAGMQLDSAIRILAKIDTVKQYNLLQQKEVILPEKNVRQTDEKKSKNRLYILGGVFFGLILVLVVMLVLQPH